MKSLQITEKRKYINIFQSECLHKLTLYLSNLEYVINLIYEAVSESFCTYINTYNHCKRLYEGFLCCPSPICLQIHFPVITMHKGLNFYSGIKLCCKGAFIAIFSNIFLEHNKINSYS